MGEDAAEPWASRTGTVSRRGFLALGGVSAAAVAGAFSFPGAAAAAAAQVSLDFEDGLIRSPITSSRGASVGHAFAHSGSYGCRLDPAATSDHTAFLSVTRSGFSLGKPNASLSLWFRLVTAPATSDTFMNLFEIYNTSTATTKSQFTAYFRRGRLVCDFDRSEVIDLGPVPAVGGWHQIQAVVSYGATTYTARVSYDGAPAATLTSAADKTATSVQALTFHYPKVPVDYVVDIDDVLMSTSDTPLDFFAPTASAVPTFQESFERGAVGTVPNATTTAYDQTIGDRGDGNGNVAVVLDSGGVRGHCARFSTVKVGTGTFGFLGKKVGAQRVLYFRRYYRLDVLPKYRTSVLLYKWGGTGNGQLGGTHNGSFAFGGTSQGHRFTLVDRDTNGALSTATVPLNSWFRVETKVDFSSGAGLQTARLFLGANLHGATPDEVLTNPLAGTYTDYVEDGIMTNPNTMVNVRIDEVVNGPTWPGGLV